MLSQSSAVLQTLSDMAACYDTVVIRSQPSTDYAYVIS
jgi:hypothetical protein